MILLDTSIYIQCLSDKELEQKVGELGRKSFIMSSEVIEREIKEALDFLRKRGDKSNAENLSVIYNSSISGTIKMTERVASLADKYFNEVKSRFGKDKAKKMTDDLRIVASASIGTVRYIGTFNRKTMASQEVIDIYSRINSGMKLSTPAFIQTKEDLLAFIFSL